MPILKYEYTPLFRLDPEDKKFKEFGQKESVPLIAAATPELLQSFLRRM